MSEATMIHDQEASTVERNLQKRLEDEGLSPHQATNVVSEFVSSRPTILTGTMPFHSAWSLLVRVAVRYLEEVCPMHYKLEHFRQLAAQNAA